MDMDKKIAIVTGASSGIGAAIAEMLLDLNYEVYGFGRHFPAEAEKAVEARADAEIEHADAASGKSADRESFHPIVCDLLDTNRVLQEIRAIEKQGNVSILVNNAGVAYYGLHEELNPGKFRK